MTTFSVPSEELKAHPDFLDAMRKLAKQHSITINIQSPESDELELSAESLASLRKGIDEARAGKIIPMGDFTQYLEDDTR